jgi:hypothetical protein
MWTFLDVDQPENDSVPSQQVISGLISIKNISGQYMRVTAHNKDLEFNSNQCDNKAIFAVQPLGGNMISLISKNYYFSPTHLPV